MAKEGESWNLAPVEPDERLEVIDALRGFALFGILSVNMLAIGSPIRWVVDPPWTSHADRIAFFTIQFLSSAKFFSLFSFLFGIGFAMQVARAERVGRSVTRLLLRRYAALLAFGAIHALLVWYGDILHQYALLGLLLIGFRDAPPREILRIAGVSILIPIAIVASSLALSVSHAGDATTGPWGAQEVEASVSAYSSGDGLAVARARWHDLREMERGAVEYLPHIFGLFLAGVWCGRARLFEQIEQQSAKLRRVVIVGLIVGVPANLAMAFASFMQDPLRMNRAIYVVAILRVIGGTAFCAAYAAVFALLWRSDRWRRRLGALAPAGRMALTNYLLQSVVGTAIFYSWGLGLYGSTGPALQTCIAVAVFAMQVAASRRWLSRYRFGPMEWLWRAITYGEPIAMRRDSS